MNAVMTWEQMGIFIAISLAVYYGIVLAIFFSRQVWNLSPASPSEKSDQSPVQHSNKSQRDLIYELMEDCKPVFREAVSQKLDRKEVLDALRFRVG